MSNPHDWSNADDELWRSGPTYLSSQRPLARYVARPFREFLRVETSGSIVLLLAAAVALVWANSPWGGSYTEFWHTDLGLGFGPWDLSGDLHFWVNDALMVIFFFVVGLEIKYEIVHGDLRDPKTAALPIIAAFGGMIVPALIYRLVVGDSGAAHGWGIPMATDIAFAVGVLGLLGRRIPSAARLFLLTLAIVDDIGAILVIAVFYATDLALGWLGLAIAGILVMALLRVLRVWIFWVYIALGFAVWFAVLQSGVHATLAGVAIGLLAPTVPLLKEDVARGFAGQALHDNHLDADELSRLRFLLAESVPVVERLQSLLHPFSAYVVLPVFALANAGVDLRGGVLEEALTSPVAHGVTLGLLVGKPVGVVLFSWLAVVLKLGRPPLGTTWPLMTGLGLVAGIGFTVSLFIAGLSFPGVEEFTDAAKVGILGASVLAAALGALLLLLTSHPDAESLAEAAAAEEDALDDGM